MKKSIINHGLLHDDINYEALIEAQANNEIFLEGKKNKITSKKEEKSKAKKLTKCYIRGRLNK